MLSGHVLFSPLSEHLFSLPIHHVIHLFAHSVWTRVVCLLFAVSLARSLWRACAFVYVCNLKIRNSMSIRWSIFVVIFNPGFNLAGRLSHVSSALTLRVWSITRISGFTKWGFLSSCIKWGFLMLSLGSHFLSTYNLFNTFRSGLKMFFMSQ